MSLTKDYLQKLNIAKDILIKNYIIIAEKKEFLLLIDKNKVYSVTINEFNQIINRDCFSDVERAYIREQRKKAVNRKAARVSRMRRKNEEFSLEYSVRKLEMVKCELLREQMCLEKEIVFYQLQCQQERYQPTQQWTDTHQNTVFHPHFTY